MFAPKYAKRQEVFSVEEGNSILSLEEFSQQEKQHEKHSTTEENSGVHEAQNKT